MRCQVEERDFLAPPLRHLKGAGEVFLRWVVEGNLAAQDHLREHQGRKYLRVS
jgi:hypothetical protein